MPRKPRTNPLLLTDVELDVMRCMWEIGNAPASQVQMQIMRSGKVVAYMTVKAMLDRLVRARVCASHGTRRRYLYSPKITQNEVAEAWYRHLRKKSTVVPLKLKIIACICRLAGAKLFPVVDR
jgi:predicted transcriptional regulator